jgi:hypothetical protein
MKPLLSKSYFSSILVSLLISFAVISISHGATLKWDANSEEDLAGYKIYYGASSIGYVSYDVGNVTELELATLSLYENEVYWIAVTAHDTSGNESAPSSPLYYTVDEGIDPPNDNCPDTPNPNQLDNDQDGLGDLCDDCTDTDGDGYGNPGFPANTCDEDNCPDISSPDLTNSDNDSHGDACDNCPNVDNEDQSDSDGDELGDACDECPNDTDNDIDEDGACGDEDNCPDTPNGPYAGTCIYGDRGESCSIPEFNPFECGDSGYCSMNQEDTDGDELGDACDECSVDEDCDDGLYCNGIEFCVGGVYCQNGTTPCPADDGLYCNGTESCDEGNDQCENSGDPCENCYVINCTCNETVDQCEGCYADDDCDSICNPGESLPTCSGSDNCPNTPNTDQLDTYPPDGGNGCGDACECEGDFNSDGIVNFSELRQFSIDFGRADCTEDNPCKGDYNCDGMVDDFDFRQFEIDFWTEKCPICPTDPWCVY